MPNFINYMNSFNVDNEKIAVDSKLLSSNVADIIGDCNATGKELAHEIITRFPLVDWLLNTPLSRQQRNNERLGLCQRYKDSGKWYLRVPALIYSELPTSTENECCWTSFDFAKCAGVVEINKLCLKDCQDVMDDMMYRNTVVGSTNAVPGLAGGSESVAAVQERIARYSMAFLSAMNIIRGMDNTFTDTLKPFHGLMQVMSNPAVDTINGANVLSAFASLGCRVAVLGGAEQFIIAIHPIAYESLLEVIVPGQYGYLPAGWTRNGDEIRYRGMRFLRDASMPVDLSAGTAEAWVMSGEAVGLYMATDLIPAQGFVKKSGFLEDTYANGCGSECTYYFNAGAAFSNNAFKTIKIADIPISGACLAGVSDLGAIVSPETLVPYPA